MFRNLLLAGAVVLLGASQPVLAQSKPIDLVRQAVEAEGGADALRGLKTISITAATKHWEQEQSDIADGPPRPLGQGKVKLSRDLQRGMVRAQWDRTMTYFPSGKETYTEILTPSFGAVISDKGERAMSGTRLAVELREAERTSPTLLLKALAAPSSVSALPNQMSRGRSLPAVAFQDGPTRFVILFDRTTHLPAVIRTQDVDDIHGDADLDLVLGNWKPVDGVQIAHSLKYTLAGSDNRTITYTSVKTNVGMSSKTFAVSDATRQAAKPPRTDVDWLGVLSRLNFGGYDDTNADNRPPDIGMKLVEISTNIQHAVGRSHNSLIVALKDYLVVFDAPQNEAQARWTIDAAKGKYPGKPVKYLVQTHHHFDHLGGVRTFIAEGATIIVGTPNNAAHIAKVARWPHTRVPDELQKNPKQPSVIEIADKMSLKDETGEVNIFRIENPHAQGMLIGFMMPQNLVYVTDLYSPGRERAKTGGNMAFDAALKKLNLAPAQIAGGHGGVGPGSDLEALMSAR